MSAPRTAPGRALHDHYHEDGADHSGCLLNQKIAAVEAQARSEGYEYGLLHNEAPEIGAAAHASRKATVKRIRASVLAVAGRHADGWTYIDTESVERFLDAEAAR